MMSIRPSVREAPRSTCQLWFRPLFAAHQRVVLDPSLPSDATLPVPVWRPGDALLGKGSASAGPPPAPAVALPPVPAVLLPPVPAVLLPPVPAVALPPEPPFPPPAP